MKREFLQNFKVGEAQLPKEVIDAIMDENGRDINAAKAQFADYETLKTANAEYANTIKELQGKQGNADDMAKTINDLQEKIAQMDAEHKQQLADRDFRDSLDKAIATAHGRSAKAISALLDIDALKASKNQSADISAAVEALKKDSAYLFETEQTPPPYSPGSGSGSGKPTGIDAIRAAAGLNK